ncbi:hypothetical protein [Bacillus sp. NPDC094077]
MKVLRDQLRERKKQSKQTREKKDIEFKWLRDNLKIEIKGS